MKLVDKMNPQPLDLEDKNERVKLASEISEIWFLEYLKTYYSEEDLEDVREELKKIKLEMRDFAIFCIERFIKQRLKSACEFFLQYMDKPYTFLSEQWEIAQKEKIKEKFYTRGYGWSLYDYNEWLFRLAFKDVLEGEKNDNEL